MRQNAASHQGLHCLPLIQQFLDTTSGSKLYKFLNKHGKELRYPNTYGKYGNAFCVIVGILMRTGAQQY